MAWKKYSQLSAREKALRLAKKSITNSIMSPEAKKFEREQKKKKTISTDWS